jgi:hypothetical protein
LKLSWINRKNISKGVMASDKKNLEAIKEHLDEGETVVHCCSGLFKTSMLGKDSKNNGIFAATQSRAILFGKKMFGYDMESFPMSKISAIEMSKGIFGKKINLRMSGNTAEMSMISQGDPDGFVAYVRENMGEKAAPAAAPADDIPAQIQKLAALKGLGILTEDEFAAKKAELLAKM